MNSTLSHALTINRVTLSLTEAIPLAQQQQWQRHLHRSLGKVSVTPALPPQAILIVHHLADPQPGKLLTDPGRKTWETAAQNALNDCWRKAVRPISQTVSTATNSVWFADSAEWLTCLSLDVLRGVAGDRWWWQTSLKPYLSLLGPNRPSAQSNHAQTISYLWQDHAQWLPPALNHLVRQHPAEIVSLLKSFTQAQLQSVFTQLTQAYNLPSLPSALSDLPPNLPTLLRPHLPDSIGSGLLSLTAKTQSFLAISLTLPHTERWLQTATAKITSEKSDLQQSRAEGEIFPQQDFAIGQERRTQAEITDLGKPGSAPKTSPSKRSEFPRPTAPRIVSIQSTPLNSAPTEIEQLETEQASPAKTAERPTQSATTLLTSQSEITTSLLSSSEEGIVTTVGGLWYLVNVLVELAWAAGSSSLNPWYQLISLTQSFLPKIPSDPVWALLAEAADDPDALSTVHQLLSRANAPLHWQTETLCQARTYLQNKSLLAPGDASHVLSTYLLEPALLYFTRTHIDVVFSLKQIQMGLRLAGLDQNPGWVPELGRVITFHYE